MGRRRREPTPPLPPPHRQAGSVRTHPRAGQWSVAWLTWLVAGLATAAAPVPIPGLVATGMSPTGQPLPGGSPDPHWRLIESADPTSPGPSAFVVSDGYPIPPWLANNASSKWIAPRANQTSGNRPGTYRYRLSFNLTGLDPVTAAITGRWSSDNAGTEVLLNGSPTGFGQDGDFGAFSPFFTIRSPFAPGINVLEFTVQNAGDSINPTGFRAELTGTAEPLPSGSTPPSIRTQPGGADVGFKGSAHTRVEASGTPPLTYQWRRQGVPLADQTEAMLEWPYAVPAESGLYDVVVTNPFGAITSQVVRLTVSGEVFDPRRPESPGPSTRRTAITFSEVHHQPPTDGTGRDLRFVELYNSNPFPEDLSGWSLTGDMDFTFAEGTVLPGLGYLVVAPRPDDIGAVYGITNRTGGFSSRFGPDRGTLRLRKRSGGVVLQTEFTSDKAWEPASRGGGPSRVLARPTLGEADPEGWSASVFVGGSPGGPEPEPPAPLSGIRFNEILPESTGATAAFLELHNRSPLAADVSEAVLASPDSTATLTLPPDSIVPPGGFLILDSPALAQLLHPAGGTLLLRSPDGRRVLDALAYPGIRPGLSHGRLPEGSSQWGATESPTPGAANARAHRSEIVFSEIHFEPLSGDEDEEYLELHNRASVAVDLGQWQIAGGIRFTFPTGTYLAPGGFLVLARNLERFQQQHPDVPHERSVGNFQGALRNRGEHLTLLRPVRFPTDPSPFGTPSPPPIRHLAVEEEVRFQPGAHGNRWAAGGGSSLERIDFDAPAHDTSTWRDSDESDKAPWTRVEAIGPLTLTHPGVPAADQLQILLLGPGEALVDDVEVMVTGANRITNGRFESGTTGWFFQGTHRSSRIDANAGPDGSHALHLIASERGDHVANRIRTVLTTPIPPNAIATLRAKVRWLSGHPEILLRLRNGGLEAFGRLAVPTSTGTPGTTNSRSTDNAAPGLLRLDHHPILPATGQRVRVFAQLSDPDGIEAVHLAYRRDPATATTTLPMLDDGTGPDEFAEDGIFTGSIPGQSEGSLIAFQVLATDRLGANASFPARNGSTTRDYLLRFGEDSPSGAFGSYRIWMTAATRDAWTRREKMSNEDLDVTFVSGTDRVIRNAGAHYSGSSYTSPIYDSPTGALCGYDLSFPQDDLFLGADRATLDWPIRDNTNQREQLMFWFLEQYGLPNLHRRYVRLTVNGVRRGTLYDDVQQPDRDAIEQWYPDDDRGSLWKTDCWNEFDNAGTRIDPCILNTLERFPASGPKKTGRYRWNWRPRAVQTSANDFTDLFALVDAANATANYVPTVETLVDVDHWMRTFAMNDLASYWDAFGNPNAKNTFLYKPQQRGWQLFSWDFDVGLGVFNDPPTAALFDVNDPTLARMYRTPAFVRRYWAALEEALDDWFRTGPGTPIDRLLDSKYAAFQTHGIALANPGPIKSWIRQRRSYLIQQLAGVRSDFAITTGTGTESVSAEESVLLRGRAPVGVASIRIQGRDRTLTWTSVSNWNVRVPLQRGVNDLTVEGFDRLGRPIADATARIQVTFTGSPGPLPLLRINEWLAQNSGSLTNPLTGETDDWFELYNAGSTSLDLSGYSLTDRLSDPGRSLIPAGFELPAGRHLLVWADERPEASRPGGDLHVDFRLSQDGEVIALHDPLGRPVDSVVFGAQYPDRSEGRWPDGALPPFPPFSTPTPGRSNDTPPSSPPTFQVFASWNPERLGLDITWTTVPGRRYQPEFTEALDTPSWQAFGPPIAPQAATHTVVDSEPFATRRFYRVVLLP